MTSASNSYPHKIILGENAERIKFSPNHLKVLLILSHHRLMRAKDLEEIFGSKSVYMYLPDLQKVGFVINVRGKGRSSYYSITEEGMRAAESIRLYFEVQDIEKSLFEGIRQFALEAGISGDIKELDVYSKIIAKAFQEEISENPNELNDLLKNPRAKILSLIKSAKENETIRNRLHSTIVLMSQCYHVELDKLQLRRLKGWFNKLVEEVYRSQMKLIIYLALPIIICILISLLLRFL